MEQTIRGIIRDKYAGHWQGGVEKAVRRALGDGSWSVVERNREKYGKQYRTTPADGEIDLFDFLYLGQLGQLMMANEAWDLFRGPLSRQA